MTNFEKTRLESFNSHAISAGKVKKGIGADNGIMASHGEGVTFADSLYSITAQTVGAWTAAGEENVSEVSSVPTDWTYKGYWGYYASVMGVKEYMTNELGIDPDNRVFTREITEEQREWLASRHDIEALKNASVDSREFGNFMADLYYLGVYSAQDVMKFCSPEVGINLNLSYEGQRGAIMKIGELADFSDPNRDDIALEYIKKILELQKKHFDYLKKEIDSTELQRLQDFLNHKQKLHDVIWDFFSLPDNDEKGFSFDENRNVSDASKRLKEDFGSRL